MNVVEIQGLTKTYPGGVEALAGLDLTVAEGEIFGVVGPDGAGKTTLMKVLAGLLSPGEGQSRVLGLDLRQGVEKVKEQIGYLPQRFSLYGDLTVAENLQFYSSLYPRSSLERTQELLERLEMAPFTDRLAARLSGGMKQKLALLCSLVHGPKILLMDEPTVGVDPVSRREFWQIVFDLQAEGRTVVASTPYMDEAEQFDRLALLDRGRFLQVGTADQIKETMREVVVELTCPEPFEAGHRLRRVEGIQDVQLFGNRLHLFVSPELENLESRVQQAGVRVDRLKRVKPSIEDVFLTLSEAR